MANPINDLYIDINDEDIYSMFNGFSAGDTAEVVIESIKKRRVGNSVDRNNKPVRGLCFCFKNDSRILWFGQCANGKVKTPICMHNDKNQVLALNARNTGSFVSDFRAFADGKRAAELREHFEEKTLVITATLGYRVPEKGEVPSDFVHLHIDYKDQPTENPYKDVLAKSATLA